MKLINDNLALLLLRLAVGGMMLLHGIHKLVGGHGFIEGKLIEAGLPGFLWLGVPVGEVLAPILMIIGYKTRISSLVVAITMAMSIYLVFMSKIFTLNENGGWIIELNVLYLVGALAIFLQGPGNYAISNKQGLLD